jgi:hypothetical protein
VTELGSQVQEVQGEGGKPGDANGDPTAGVGFSGGGPGSPMSAIAITIAEHAEPTWIILRRDDPRSKAMEMRLRQRWAPLEDQRLRAKWGLAPKLTRDEDAYRIYLQDILRGIARLQPALIDNPPKAVEALRFAARSLLRTAKRRLDVMRTWYVSFVSPSASARP